MTATLRWLNRPTPYTDESLAGFLSRWAYMNVMQSRGSMLHSLGISRAIRVSQADLEAIAAALGIECSALQTITSSDSPAYPALRRSLTRLRGEAVCPQCLAEAAYSRQLWSHALATTCPTHRVRLIDRCQKCKDGILNTRSLPHLCDCGADLRLQNSVFGTPEEVEFSNLLMGVRPKNPLLPFAFEGSIPADLDLFLLGFANHFGDTNIQITKLSKAPIPSTVEQAHARLLPAFELLRAWPNAFDMKLLTLVEQPTVMTTTGVASRLGTWYTFLFRKFTHPAFEPFRVAAANRIMSSYDGVLNARTRNVTAIATVEKNWFSVLEAARELGVSGDRINKGIDHGTIKAQIHDEAAGYRQRFVPKDEIDRLKSIQLDHVDAGAARAVLCVPKAIFALMVDAGCILISHPDSVPPVVSGYVQLSKLQHLVIRLKASVQNRIGNISVPLRDLNLRRTTDRQRLISMFVDITSGDMKPVGDEGGDGIGGLLFLQSEVDSHVSSRIVARKLTLEQVSALTAAHYDAVKGWIEAGLLPATREHQEHGAPWVIEIQALVSFLLSYTPLATHAAACTSTSRGLSATLERHRIKLVEGTEKRGTLVKLSDVFKALREPVPYAEQRELGSSPKRH